MQGLITLIKNIELEKIKMSHLYADFIFNNQSKNCVATLLITITIRYLLLMIFQ